MDYRDNLYKIFDGNVPSSLRIIFDNGSEEWHSVMTLKKTEYLEKMLMSGYSLDYWLRGYTEQYQDTHKHIINAIYPSLLFLLDHVKVNEVKDQIKSWLNDPSNIVKSKSQIIVDEILEFIKKEPQFKIKHAFEQNQFPIGSTVEFSSSRISSNELTRQHLGATIIDAMLSAASPYETAVRPRVEKFRSDYPLANTTSAFLEVINSNDMERVLTWKGIKVRRIIALAKFLKAKNIETEIELKSWLDNIDHENEIKTINGIKSGTVEYLKILCGSKTSFVLNTHVLRFFEAHTSLLTKHSESLKTSYSKSILEEVASRLNTDLATLDYSIWDYMSKTKKETSLKKEINPKKETIMNKENNDTVKLSLFDTCLHVLNFEPNERYNFQYDNVPFCVIDSVFSIGVKYESVENVLENVSRYLKVEKYAKNKLISKQSDQFSTLDFLNLTNNMPTEDLVEKVFKNKQRTSTNNGILKVEACMQFMQVLKKYNVVYLQDLPNAFYNKELENDIKSIKGQSSGISLKYFYMLGGLEDLIKPDRMIMKFLSEQTARKFTSDEAQEELLLIAQELSKKLNRKISAAFLDNKIWEYQRNQK